MGTKKGKKISPGSSAPPAGPDQFLMLDNRPPDCELPGELAEAATRRIWLQGSEQVGASGRRHPARNDAGPAEFVLSPGSGLGLPGRVHARSAPAEVERAAGGARGDDKKVDGFRPPWIGFAPHAKVASATRPLLRRRNGDLVQPHYGVFGADDRQVYYPEGYPWHCIGKLFVWEDFSQPMPSGGGSGVLIGPRHVLTAGHVVPWDSPNWAMLFIPACYDGGSQIGAGVSSWVSDTQGYDTGERVSGWDMAVLRLYDPLGSHYGYFGTKNYSSSWQGGNYWTLAGYPDAVAGGQRPSRQMWWPVLDDDSDGDAKEIEYEADATDGVSGGPVFGFWPDGFPYAIGTQSGGIIVRYKLPFGGPKIVVEDTNLAAGGSALNDLVRWARNNWP